MMNVSIILFLIGGALSTWTWISGSDQPNADAVFGTMGEPSPDNTPGAIFGHAMALGPEGTLFIGAGTKFGYQRSDDVWKFDPVSDEWTWLYGSGSGSTPKVNYNLTKGVPSPRVVPGGRHLAAAFFDLSTNTFWIFGGMLDPFDQYTLPTNTMYKFDVDMGMWTWVSGFTFGYDPSLSSGFAEFGNHGTKGVEDPTVYPQPMFGPGFYTDNSQRAFYVFGGAFGSGSSDIITTVGVLRFNDLWRYNVSTGMWAWLGGSAATNSPGVPGNAKKPYDDYNYPGARAGCNLVVDSGRGVALIFGGFGYGITTLGSLNDMWIFDFNRAQYAFLKGDKDPSTATGVFGLRNEFGTRAVPKPRWSSFIGIDTTKGFIYLFGGQNFKQGTTSTRVYYYDGWKYDYTVTFNWAWISGGSEPDSPGFFGDLNVPRFIDTPPGKSTGGYVYSSFDNKFYVHGGEINPNDQPVNDMFNFVDDITERLFYLSTLSAASVTHPAPRSYSARFKEDQSFTNGDGVGLAVLKNPYVIIGIVFAIIIVVVAVAALVYTRRKDKEAGFESFFSTKAGDTTMTTATTRSKGKSNNATKIKTRLADDTTGLIAGHTKPDTITDLDDDIEVVKPPLPYHLQSDKSVFILGQKVGSQNGVAMYSGSAVSETLKVFGEHLHIKFYGESLQLIRKREQQTFWDEVALLDSLGDHGVFAKMLTYCVEPVAIVFPYYPLGNLEQVFLSRNQTFRPYNVLRIAYNMASALHLLHEKNMAHRNFKPRNIFLNEDVAPNGDVILTCVVTGVGGILRCDNEEVVNKAYTKIRIDSTSASYAAPELFLAMKGFPPTVRVQQAIKAADTFAFAAILCKLLKSINEWY